MATRLHERLAQVTLRPHPAEARDWRAAFADAALRQRLHGVALLLVSVVGVITGLLVAGLGSATVLGTGLGVYGLYLWRR